MPKQTLIPGKKKEKGKGTFPNLGGAPITYDPVLLPTILEAVFTLKGSLAQVAWKIGVHRATFQDWIKYGEADQLKGLDTHLSQLSAGIRAQQANVLNWIFDEAHEDPRKAKFLTWWASNVFRADFGNDANLIQLLLDRTSKLEQSLKTLDSASQIISEGNSEPKEAGEA